MKVDLMKCESVAEMLSLLSSKYDLTGSLSYSKKLILVSGLAKAISLLNPPVKK